MNAIAISAAGLQAADARLASAARDVAAGADPTRPLVEAAAAGPEASANVAAIQVAETLTKALLDIRV